MRLSSVRELKQELGEKQRNTFTALGLGDGSAQESPIAKGIMRLGSGPEDFGATIRVYKGKDNLAQELLKPYVRLAREVRVVRGVSYFPRGGMLTSGLSIGHPKITAGTLGGFVCDRGGVYILSNNHVLANSNKAQANDPIITPGRADRGAGSCRVIGRLHRWMELDAHTKTGVDAAVAKLRKGTPYKPSYVPGVGRVERTPITKDELEAVQDVFKYGRTTKLTRGTVKAFELDDVKVPYGDGSFSVVFDDQIEFVLSEPGKPFSKGGDSGSVIYDSASRRPYALLFAGGVSKDGHDRTLGHFLPGVLEALGVEML